MADRSSFWSQADKQLTDFSSYFCCRTRCLEYKTRFLSSKPLQQELLGISNHIIVNPSCQSHRHSHFYHLPCLMGSLFRRCSIRLIWGKVWINSKHYKDFFGLSCSQGDDHFFFGVFKESIKCLPSLQVSLQTRMANRFLCNACIKCLAMEAIFIQ